VVILRPKPCIWHNPRMLALLVAVTFQQPTAGHPITLRTDYRGDRFVVSGTTLNGMTLKFFTDSAGGFFMTKRAALAIGAQTTKLDEKAEGGESIQQTGFPSFKSDSMIPAPVGASQKIMVLDLKEGGPKTDLSEFDGMLGQQWFGGHAWTFDYPGKQLWWRANGDLPKHDQTHEAKLYFKKSRNGEHETNFARFQIKIDGQPYDFLFDTGATDVLDKDALGFVNDGGPSVRATSFMALNLFEKLHTAHPDWKVYDKPTTTGRKMLQVPKVEIGGYEVGPVWFSIQGDNAFHNYMAQWMDKPTEGAIGGSALHYLRVSVDWLAEIAVFEKP